MSKKVPDNIEFYCQQYLNEQIRTKSYDSVMQYPTTLLVIFIGGVFYSFNNYFQNGPIKICGSLDWVFISFIFLFGLCTLGATYYLALVFHGFTRTYKYIPFTGVLANHEQSLFNFYYENSTKKTNRKKKLEAKIKSRKEFNRNLKDYYIEYTEINQRINDKRAIFYYYTRTLLFIDLILLIAIGIIGQLNL